MPVILKQSKSLSPDAQAAPFVVIGTAKPANLALAPLPDISRRLEEAFDGVRREWADIALCLTHKDSYPRAQMLGIAPTVSDFGLMLAWSKLVAELAGDAARTVVVCDDPWLYRHLATLDGVEPDRPPSLTLLRLKLAVRGFLSRTKAAVRLAKASIIFRNHKKRLKRHEHAILVYGHTLSGADGYDGYFGNMLAQINNLIRIVHTDGALATHARLCTHDRTVSLHAWGSVFFAFSLPFKAWKVFSHKRMEPYKWLISRAVALEGSSGQGAMFAWQAHCQANLVQEKSPKAIAWPWENHVWERHFVTQLRANGTKSIGFMHVPFGRHHWGISPISNPEGLENCPDALACTGTKVRSKLVDLGYPERIITVTGVLRNVNFTSLKYDPAGPVLFALPSLPSITSQMERVAQQFTKRGVSVIVRAHPMAARSYRKLPVELYYDGPLAELEPISCMIFAISSVALEGLATGIPVIRFRPSGIVAPIPILPDDLDVPVADEETIYATLDNVPIPNPIDATDYYGPLQPDIWEQLLANKA